MSATIPPEDYPSIVERRLAGETLQAIADTYGVSRERIRQVVKQVDASVPEALRSTAEVRRERSEEQELSNKLTRRMEAALKHDRKCQVCGAWVLRGNYVNCSPEHTEAWSYLRVVDNPLEHRRYMAKTYLDKPERYSESNLDWARRVMSGEVTEGNRRYLIPGSKSAEYIRKYRPEVYEELLGEDE